VMRSNDPDIHHARSLAGPVITPPMRKAFIS
jgi:hypothetical protein